MSPKDTKKEYVIPGPIEEVRETILDNQYMKIYGPDLSLIISNKKYGIINRDFSKESINLKSKACFDGSEFLLKSITTKQHTILKFRVIDPKQNYKEIGMTSIQLKSIDNDTATVATTCTSIFESHISALEDS